MSEKKSTNKKITRVDGTPVRASKEERRGAAKIWRILAFVMWFLGIACEIVAVLILNGYIYTGDAKLYWLLGVLALDLILVIVGSQFWKKGNDIDPVSESNKVKYFLWNQMGLIMSVIAFFPFIILLLNNKDLDAKTKRILTIAAIIALAICSLFSIDWNPMSQEEYEEATTVLAGEEVYWTRYGKSYHLDPECSSLSRSSELFAGTIQQAIEANRNDPCDFCVPQLHK